RKCRLQVERDRIINFRPDVPFREKLLQLIPPRSANDVLMEIMHCTRNKLRQNHWGAWPKLAACETGRLQKAVIVSCMFASLLIPLLHVLKLHPQDCCLNRIHTAVPACFVVLITSRAAMVSQPPHALGQFLIGRNGQSRVAECTQILCRIKTESSCHSYATGLVLMVFRSDGLSRIFNQRQLEFIR